MRVMGHNALAVLLAAIAIYAIEFVIFAVLMTPEQYGALSGYTGGDVSRMPIGIVSPIFAAIGISLAIKWRNQPGWLAGAITGALMGLYFSFGASLYSYVYGPNTIEFALINLGHYIGCYAVAGAILGAWK